MDGKQIYLLLFFDCNNEICIELYREGESSGGGEDNRGSLQKRIQT